MRALLAAALLVLPLAAQERTTAPPARDAAAQEEIRAAVHAPDAGAAQEALAVLARRAAADPIAFTGQLVHYGLASRTTRDGMAFGALREALGLPDGTVLLGTLPFLESEEPEVVAHAARVLEEFEDPDPDRPPTFAPYRPILAEARRKGERPPTGLLRHLVTRDAGVALVLFTRVWVDDGAERRPYLMAEHVLADLAWRERHGFPVDAARRAAASELARMAADTHWWARLAAAGALADRPGLAPAALERLARDADPLVRELARAGLPR